MEEETPPEKTPAEAEAPTTTQETPLEAEPATAAAQPSSRRSWTSHLTEIPMLVVLAFVIAVVIKTFLVQAFFIPSESMLPALHPGDRVLVEKLSYWLDPPRQGDVVVFEREVFGEAPDVAWYLDIRNFLRELLGLPTGLEEDYIKRIVAVAGDTISYTGKPRLLRVNGDEVDQSYIRGGRDRWSSSLSKDDCERLQMRPTDDGCLVPAGKVFVMGDNRGDSEDSRILGPISQDKIVGRAFLLIWPPGNIGSL